MRPADTAEETTTMTTCACARNRDGSTTTFLCPTHASNDPCATTAAVTGRRRKGSIRKGRCTNCGWQQPLLTPTPKGN